MSLVANFSISLVNFSEIQKSSAKVEILNILIIQQTLAKSIQGSHVSLGSSHFYYKISEVSCDYKFHVCVPASIHMDINVGFCAKFHKTV